MMMGFVAGVSIVMDAPLRSTSVAVRIKGWMPGRGIEIEFFFLKLRSKVEKREHKRLFALALACFLRKQKKSRFFLSSGAHSLRRISLSLAAATADAGALVGGARGVVLWPRRRCRCEGIAFVVDDVDVEKEEGFGDGSRPAAPIEVRSFSSPFPLIFLNRSLRWSRVTCS